MGLGHKGPVSDGAKLYTGSDQLGHLVTQAACSEVSTFSGFLEQRWYALYTCANQEKRVAEQLETRSVEHLLPLYGSVRRWKDRRVRLQLPLFPGYVFVRLALKDRLQVLQIPRVAYLVGFNGSPTPLEEAEVSMLRKCLSMINRTDQVEPHPYLCSGQRARVANGPLNGMEGVVVYWKNRTRVIVSFDLIMRSISVEVDEADLIPIIG